MAPKKDAGKGKAADKGGKKGDDSSSGKVKGAQSINVRHVLCEKHSKKEEAVAKLNEGVRFDEVARNFSEDKARQGTMVSLSSYSVSTVSTNSSSDT